MDAIELLKQDHETVRELFAAIEAAAGARDRADLFAELKRTLDVHERLEEDVFYPAARDAGEEAAEIVNQSHEQHAEVDELIEEMSALDESDEEWLDHLAALKEMVDHHVDIEEDVLFPLVQEALADRLTGLLDEMQELEAVLEDEEQERHQHL